jgi:hypothetical protein
MVSLGSLWLPVLLSAVLVFIVSSLVHMVLKYHAADYRQIPNEDGIRAAIRSGSPPPAQYIIPYCAEMGQMASPEMQQKYTQGPVAVVNIMRSAVPNMSRPLISWFLFSLIVSFFIAYIVSHTVPLGARYLEVFRIVGAIGFLAYAAGMVPPSIWMGKPWSITWKEVFDGLLYGLVTAGTFGWLWPR